ncbi:MAG: gliding motility-associated C-terminal domain-containing protein [Bacteroidia bacterium]|nr:gliding motility-associated C-terminal domain-containing protein [Bacteroidia bacterium]
MKIKVLLNFSVAIFLILISKDLKSQVNPSVVAYSDTVICGGNPAILHAEATGFQIAWGTVISNAADPNNVLTDDQFYGQVVNIGFPFTFYGNTYNQVLISTNNYLSFDLNNNTAGGYSPWSISGTIPDAAQTNILNSILGPWQDILPTSGGIIKYAIVGLAPNRVFVLDYNSVSMFSCTTLNFTSQIQIFETSNVIETHITNKPICSTWNNGQAIHGLHNANGTIAHVVPGRNAGNQWTANNEGYRFTPAGPTNYTIAPIPFNPIPITSGGGEVIWTLNGTQVGIGDTLIVSPPVTSTYIASVFDPFSNVTYADTVTVTVTNTQLQTTMDSVNCHGGNNGIIAAIPFGNFGPYDYYWTNLAGVPQRQIFNIAGADSLENLSAGNYIVSMVDISGCALVDTVEVLEPNPIQINVVPTDNLCFGNNTGKATATVTGGTFPYTYLWDDFLNQTTPIADSLYAGAYKLTVRDYHNCLDTAWITIGQPPLMVLTTSTVTDTCEKGLGIARVNVQGGTPFYSYFWLTDSIDQSIAPNIFAGLHYVIVTDANNCTDTAEAMVQNIVSPIAEFEFTPDENGILYPEVVFGNLSENSSSYQWNFGDGSSSSNELHPVHLFPGADSFYVSLIAYNDYNCSDTISHFISFPQMFTMYIPNAFTPNNDGLNDTFTPKGLDFEPASYIMTIYNRWGQEIFKSKDFKNPWDGKDRSGNVLGPGVYAYSIVIGEWTGYTRKFAGNITIAK